MVMEGEIIMPEETTQTNVSSPTELGNETDYISAIKDLKANTVSKSEYEKLQAENKQLIDALANGETIPASAETEKPSLDELRANLMKEEQSNLEFVKNVLALRNAVIEQEGYDPFVPNGSQYVPTPEDVEIAQKVADVYQECVDYANGDSQLFTNELMRRTIDVSPMAKKK